MMSKGILFTASLFLIFTLLIRCTTAPSPLNHYPATASIDSLLLRAIKSTNDLNFEQALSELNQVVTLSRERGDEKNEILGHINLGALYIKYSVQDEALKYFLQSLELAQYYKRDDLLNNIYNTIGIVYATNNATDKAIEYYEKALEISRKQTNKRRMALNLINLGTEVHKKGNEALGLDYFKQALKIFETDKDTLNASIAINNTANINFDRAKYDTALLQYRQAYRMSLEVRDKFYNPQYCQGLGKTYIKLKQYDSASHYLQKALAGFRETSSIENIIEVYKRLSDVEEASGSLSKAIGFSNLSLAWKDSLLREKTTKWISELQMRYEFGIGVMVVATIMYGSTVIPVIVFGGQGDTLIIGF